jgi:transposase
MQHGVNSSVLDGEATPEPGRGLSPRDVCRRYKVGIDKVMGWIRRGELKAINVATALCGKPRWVVTPEGLAEFERLRAGGPPKKQRKRRRPDSDYKDYYPD